MEREANYVAVGAFVLLVAVMTALFVYWYSDSGDQRSYTRYEIYFDGSVSGLSEGGQVRYLGVDVGRVVRIRLDRRAADRVQVIADIDSSAPISEQTLAELSLQGVTGLLYIDLQQLKPGAHGERLMGPIQSENYPVIRSIHSNFDLFLSSLPELAARAGELATRANRLLSDENIAAFNRLASSLERAGGALPQAVRDAGALIAELREATAQSREVIAQARGHAHRGAGPGRDHGAPACDGRSPGDGQRAAGRCAHGKPRCAARLHAAGTPAGRGAGARQPRGRAGIRAAREEPARKPLTAPV